MNDDQITALAREYAEEECAKSTMIDTSNLYEDKLLEFYDVYSFLLRRYSLVEKEAVRKAFADNNPEYKKTLAAKLQADDVRVLLKSLFPEIGKEVER